MSFCVKRFGLLTFVCLIIFDLTTAAAQTGRKDSRLGKLTHALIDLHEQHVTRAAERTAEPLRAPNRLVNRHLPS